MLSKLKSCKLNYLSLQWFGLYRSQKVVINSFESPVRNKDFGIPQRLILGSLLFLLYINDLPLCLGYSIPDLYVDDTTVHYSSRYVSEVNFKLNEDMKQIHKWCWYDMIILNTAKSKSMLIGLCRKLQTVNSHIAIFMIILNNVECEKLLV